jgi:hypothetical protein
MTAMHDRTWVTLSTFPFAGDAEVARGALASAGIEARILDGNMVGMLSHMTIALGGLRLQVPGDQLAEARAILGEPSAIDEEELAREAGASPDVVGPVPVTPARRSAVAVVLLALFGLTVLALAARVLGRMLGS